MNYTFYRIYSKNPDVTECYIGSTKDFHKRKINHKSTCNNINSDHYNTKIYEYMRNNGGFEEFEIEIIDIIKFSKSDRLWHERKLIEMYRPTLNIIKPIITNIEKEQDLKKCMSQYSQTHKLKIKEQQKQYYKNNLTKKNEYNKKYQMCHSDSLKEYRHQYYLKKKEEKLSQSLLAPVP